MIPGMSDMMAGNEDEAGKKMRRMAFIFDAMSTFELDSDGSCFRGPVPSSSALVATPSKGKETVKVANANGKDKASEVQEGPREPNARVLRVARGSGTSVNEVEEILAQHQMFAGMVKKAGGKGGWCVLSRPVHYDGCTDDGVACRMSKMKAQQSAMARRGGPGGAGGMPGMPDMANLSPGQLAQMQVRPLSPSLVVDCVLNRRCGRRTCSHRE
jgi:signal recognition particle subunit SRP54